MSDKFKVYGTLSLACLAFFIIGGYAMAIIENTREVSPLKFIINGALGIMFLIKGVNKAKKL